MKFPAFLLLLTVPLCLCAETSADIRDQWRRTITYGTDSQVLDIVRKLKGTEDRTFNAPLGALLAKTANTELAKAILELFENQGARDGESSARLILAEWQDRKSDLAAAAIHYLASLKADGLAKELIPLIDAPDNQVSQEAISGLGKLKDRSATPVILEKLQSPEFTEERKAQLILALGELQDPAALEALLAIVEDTGEDHVRRLYAADALGKLRDTKAIPALKKLMVEKDALSRTYAASSLANFDINEVFPDLLQGLRDDNWKVRVQCAKALARPLSPAAAAEAVPMLSYKAEKDPVNDVRMEAISALSAIGGDNAVLFLMDLYKNQGTPLAVREKALGAILGKTLGASAEKAIREAVEADRKISDKNALLIHAKALSGVKAPGLKDIYITFLENADPVIKLYGIKGVETNGFSDLKGRLQTIADKDANPSVKKEALRVMEKL